MIRHHFKYLAASGSEAAVSALADSPQTTSIISGGTWVVPELTQGRRRADCVIDLRRAGLGAVRLDPDGVLEIGTCVTYTALTMDPRVAKLTPLLARASAGITGGIQLRNVATVGGSACYATPSSDVPGVLVALGAVMVAQGPNGRRSIPANEFFTDAFTTALRETELLISISIPPQAPGGWSYRKLKLCGSSWPIATAAVVTTDTGTRRLVLGGVAPAPVTVELPMTAELDLGAVTEAANAAITTTYSDELADGAYRRRVAPALARHAWTEASHE